MPRKKKYEAQSAVFERATIYVKPELSFFGYRTIEVRHVHYEIGPYAQYQNAITLTFTPKGARIPRAIRLTNPWLVILDGWGHPPAPNDLNSVADRGDAIGYGFICVKATPGDRSEHDRFQHELAQMLDDYLPKSGAIVLADLRKLKIKETR